MVIFCDSLIDGCASLGVLGLEWAFQMWVVASEGGLVKQKEQLPQ